jgi:hypothetical protein
VNEESARFWHEVGLKFQNMRLKFVAEDLITRFVLYSYVSQKCPVPASHILILHTVPVQVL